MPSHPSAQPHFAFRLFGGRAFAWLCAGFLLGFALLLAALWLQNRRGPAAWETAVPVVLLDAAPDSDDAEN